MYYLTTEVTKQGEVKFVSKDKEINEIITKSLKRLNKASFDDYEAQTALASLIPFIMVPASFSDDNLSIDFFQEGVSGKELKKAMKNILKEYISRVSFG